MAGEGIVFKSWLDVCEDVRAGRLQVLLDGAGDSLPLNLVCPHRKQFSTALRQLQALCAERLRPMMDGLPATPV